MKRKEWTTDSMRYYAVWGVKAKEMGFLKDLLV
jgi:hypothetical protein